MKIKKNLNFVSLRTGLSAVFKKIPEFRQRGKVSISIHDAMMSGFACMYYQDPSLLQFQIKMEEEQHRNNLKTLFNVKDIPKETQMRDILDPIEGECLRPVFKDFFLRLQRGKQLEGFQVLPGLYYCPMDGTEIFSSKKVNCGHCLTKEHTVGETTHAHQVLQGGIMHPDQSFVVPFMPEEIRNTDGKQKQDCEMNAGKRFIEKTRSDHPRLGLIFGGDPLFSRQPIIEDVLSKRAHYIFVAKPTDHSFLMEWLAAYPKLDETRFTDDEGREHYYEWMNDVPLNGRKDTIRVNYFRCTIFSANKPEKIVYRNGWVTDLPITAQDIKIFVRTARCRWKVENECFNVLKNHGYCLDHNYGHGKQNLSFIFYLLTVLAFFSHQIFEMTDKNYQAARKKFGSKRHMWETLRAYIKIIIFETWEALLEFALNPPRYELSLARGS